MLCLPYAGFFFFSEILASLNFNKNKMFSPGLENNHTLKCCSGNFPTLSYISRLLKKIPDQHLNVWLFSNSRDKIQKRWRTAWKICPVLSKRIWTLSPGLENNHTFKCWFGIFPTILTYIIMLENCQNNISVYGCSPIQGTKCYPCWNSMKPGSQSGTFTLSFSAFIFLWKLWKDIFWNDFYMPFSIC